MSGFAERHNSSSNVQWGKLAAGAAIATGVVLVGLAIGNGEVPILSDIAKGVQELALSVMDSAKTLVAGATAPAPELASQSSSVFAKFGEYLGNVGTFLENNAKSLGGAALLGLGLGYMSTTHKSTPQAAPALSERAQFAQMGFAAREQMRAANALMQSRMQVFGQER